MTKERIIADCGLALALLSGIFPALVLWGAVFAYRIPRFWEFLAAGFALDLLYGAGWWKGFLPEPAFSSAILVFSAALLLRAKTRMR